MGVSSNGHICYGIAFDEGYEFPWDCDKYHSMEAWWEIEICGFAEAVEIFDSTTETGYVENVRPPEDVIDKYYRSRLEFAKEHPAPVCLVNYCSGDCPMYILALPDTYKTCWRGTPIAFSMGTNVFPQCRQELIDFCEKYCQPKDDYYKFPEMNPQWYLSSYMG